jgi:hypothetical protein
MTDCLTRYALPVTHYALQIIQPATMKQYNNETMCFFIVYQSTCGRGRIRTDDRAVMIRLL